MRNVTTTAYNFEELSKEAQKTAIENNYYYNVEFDDWYQYVYDMFDEVLEDKYGIKATKHYFSGFSCQGDGAMFEGHISDWVKFTNHFDISTGIKKLINEDINCLTWNHTGRYYHYNCVSFSEDYISDIENEVSYKGASNEDVVKVSNTLYKLHNEFIEFIKNLFKQFYRDLEAEYNGLTDDDCIRESLICNESEFNEDGTDF